MWPHFVNLLLHSWSNFLDALGTRGLGFIAPLLDSLLSIGVSLYIILRRRGREAMLKNLKEDGLTALLVTVIVTLLIYGPIFGWKLIQTTYNDHQSLATDNKNLVAANAQLTADLKDARASAEQQCEQAKGKEILRLKKQLNAVCFNPDRRLGPMEQEQLFLALKRASTEMVKQKQTSTFRMYRFRGDAEAGRFAEKLLPIFERAGWTPKFDPNSEDTIRKFNEQEKWLLDHGLTEGIMIFDKNGMKGYGVEVGLAFAALDLSDWTQSRNPPAK